MTRPRHKLNGLGIANLSKWESACVAAAAAYIMKVVALVANL